MFIFQILFLKEQSEDARDLSQCARMMLRALFDRNVAIRLTAIRKYPGKFTMKKNLPTLKSCIISKYILYMKNLKISKNRN